MRLLISALTAALVLLVTPAAAQAHGRDDGWVPAPQGSFDAPAGLDCDFAVHAEPIVDEVVQKTLRTYPDGTMKKVIYKGALIVRVTNTETGKFYDADAGSTGYAVVDYAPDGATSWYIVGPILVGLHDNPRGLFLTVAHDISRLTISATNERHFTIIRGYAINVCDLIA